MSNPKQRRESRRRRHGGLHPGWGCFFMAWLGGLCGFASGLATMEWGLAAATIGVAISVGLFFFFFIVGGRRAESHD